MFFFASERTLANATGERKLVSQRTVSRFVFAKQTMKHMRWLHGRRGHESTESSYWWVVSLPIDQCSNKDAGNSERKTQLKRCSTSSRFNVNIDQTSVRLAPNMKEIFVAEDLPFTRSERREGPADLLFGHGQERRISPCSLDLRGQGLARYTQMGPSASGLQVTHSDNHWSNQETMADLVRDLNEQMCSGNNTRARGMLCVARVEAQEHQL